MFKKAICASLLVAMGITMFGCSAKEEPKKEERKEETKKEDTLTMAEELKRDFPEIYEKATSALTGVYAALSMDLESVPEVDIVAKYPYINLYYKSNDEKEVIAYMTYAKEEEGKTGIDVRLHFDINDGTLLKASATTNNPSVSETSIIFALTHIEGLTNSTEIKDTLALKEVLAKNDEDLMEYTVSDKWITSKSVDEIATKYSISSIK